jgi:hypothetical protein
MEVWFCGETFKDSIFCSIQSILIIPMTMKKLKIVA